MNKFNGFIEEIESDNYISIVKVRTGNNFLYVLILETPETASYLQIGKQIHLIFNETEVEVIKDYSSKFNSLLNILDAIVEDFEKGKILAKVTFLCGEYKVISVMPQKSFDALNIFKGDKVKLIIRPTDISIEV